MGIINTSYFLCSLKLTSNKVNNADKKKTMIYHSDEVIKYLRLVEIMKGKV